LEIGRRKKISPTIGKEASGLERLTRVSLKIVRKYTRGQDAEERGNSGWRLGGKGNLIDMWIPNRIRLREG